MWQLGSLLSIPVPGAWHTMGTEKVYSMNARLTCERIAVAALCGQVSSSNFKVGVYIMYRKMRISVRFGSRWFCCIARGGEGTGVSSFSLSVL